MGMNSKTVQSKTDHENQEEDLAAKRKAKPGFQDFVKDDNKLRGPSSPAAVPIKDGMERRPAEVFRTDFITAMKVPDSQTLQPGKTYTLVDTWRQEWEKGVQVPVNSHALPTVSLRKKELQTPTKRYTAFGLPKTRITQDNPEYAHTNEKHTTCTYDLDDLDVRWLGMAKTKSKKGNIDESVMEKAMTYFERKCFENMAHAVATKKGLSIEYDETTICDVCLSPDTEENNEIVFCDACNMCAHQACYGLPDIPTGTWLCRPCSRGILSPACIICPNRGGAMKRLKGSFDWIHVICAWWVPEVKIEDIDNVERITIDKIPASRKNLSCHLCREKMGACIQCSVKRCVTAYHVTCGVKKGLELKTVMMHEKDDVQHISYCKRHCVPQPPDPQTQRLGENVENQRLQELQKLQENFYKLVNANKSAKELRMNRESTRTIFAYWVLKRKGNENRPLIPLTTEQQEKLSGKQGIFLIQEQINVEMERYALLRQDLERLRNLCYLIIRREKVKREVHKSSQEVFSKQNEILTDDKVTISDEEFVDISSDPRMRFTKFPFYSVDGPPYADHVGEEGTLKIGNSNASISLFGQKLLEGNAQLAESSKPDKNENNKTEGPEIHGYSANDNNKNESELINNIVQEVNESVANGSSKNNCGRSESHKNLNDYSLLLIESLRNSNSANTGSENAEILDVLSSASKYSPAREEMFSQLNADSSASVETCVEASVASSVHAGFEASVASRDNASAASSAHVGFEASVDSSVEARVDASFEASVDSSVTSSVDASVNASVASSVDANFSPSESYIDIGPVDIETSVETSIIETEMINFKSTDNDNTRCDVEQSVTSHNSPKKLSKSKANNCFVVINRMLRSSPRLNKVNCKNLSTEHHEKIKAKNSLVMDNILSENDSKIKSGIFEQVGPVQTAVADELKKPETEHESERQISNDKPETTERITRRRTRSLGLLKETKFTNSYNFLPKTNLTVCNEYDIGAPKNETKLSGDLETSLKDEKSSAVCENDISTPIANESLAANNIMDYPTLENEKSDKANARIQKSFSEAPSLGHSLDKETVSIPVEQISSEISASPAVPCNTSIDAKYISNTIMDSSDSPCNEQDLAAVFTTDLGKTKFTDEKRVANFRNICEKNGIGKPLFDERPPIDVSEHVEVNGLNKLCNLKAEICKEFNDLQNDAMIPTRSDKGFDDHDSAMTENEKKPMSLNGEIRKETILVKKNDLIFTKKQVTENVMQILDFSDNEKDKIISQRGIIIDTENDKLSSSSRNPVVLLNEISQENRDKTETRRDVDFTRSNANSIIPGIKLRTRHNSEMLDATYPSSVIDELIACPQRLTRRRTHSMMTGDSEDDSPSKNPKFNQSHKEKYTPEKNDVDDSAMNCLTEPYLIDELTACPQRLTRRRAKSLGVEKLNNAIERFELSNNLKLRQNCHLNRRNSSKRHRRRSLWDPTDGDSFPLDDLVACPQRLTRARIRSLGLGISDEEQSVSR